MKKILLWSIAAFVLVIPAGAIAAGDPLAAARRDVAKLAADADAARSTIASDASSGDVAKLKHDAKLAKSALKADWKRLLADMKAARKSKADRAELRSLLEAARRELKQFRADVKSAVAQARQESKQGKASKDKGSVESGR